MASKPQEGDGSKKENPLADIFGSSSEEEEESPSSQVANKGKRRIQSDSDEEEEERDAIGRDSRPSTPTQSQGAGRSKTLPPSSSPAHEESKENEERETSSGNRKTRTIGDDEEEEEEKGEKGERDKSEKAGSSAPPATAAELFGSDSEEEDADREKAPERVTTTKDLFGSDEEEEFDESQVRGDNRRSVRSEIYGEETMAGSQRSDEVVIPRLPAPTPSQKLVFCRLPNILGTKAEVFDRRTYDSKAEEGGEHKLFLRWRYKLDEEGKVKLDDQGKPMRESNARMVRWSDGSLQLFIGSEAIDVTQQQLINQFAYVNQTSRSDNRTETCLQCQGSVPSKFILKPHSLTSQAHQNLTLTVRARHMRGANRLGRVNKISNPEQEKEARAKMVEDQLRMQARKKQQQEYETSRSSRKRISEQFLEEDIEGEAEFEEEDISKIKGRLGLAKGRGKDKYNERFFQKGDSDQEDRGIEDYRSDMASSRLDRRREEASAAVEESSEAEEEDEEEAPIVKKRKRNVLDDDDDDE